MVTKPSAAARKQMARDAVDANDLAALERAFEAGLKLDQKLGGAGQTTLSYAVMRNQKDIIRHLLARGANPNVLSKDKTSCLHFVHEVEVARWLLAAGANPQQVSRRGEPIHHYAVTFSRQAVCRFYNTLLGRDRTPDQLSRTPAMPPERFWPLIEKAHRKSRGDEAWQARVLFMDLRHQELEEIIAFEKAFAQQHSRCATSGLWAAAYVIRGGCSDDAFFDFRSWVVSLGRKTMERAIRSPDSLLRPWKKRAHYHNYTAYEVPRLQDVGRQAYPAAAGRDDFSQVLRLASERGDWPRPGPLELDWSADDHAALQKRLPKLWAEFWED